MDVAILPQQLVLNIPILLISGQTLQNHFPQVNLHHVQPLKILFKAGFLKFGLRIHAVEKGDVLILIAAMPTCKFLKISPLLFGKRMNKAVQMISPNVVSHAFISYFTFYKGNIRLLVFDKNKHNFDDYKV